MDNKRIVGSEEWCSLPGLGLPLIKARIDSGAKTSSIHAFNIRPFEKDGKKFVKFDIHPIQDNRKISRTCEAQLIDSREIKSTSGSTEHRYIIISDIQIGGQTWPIEISLSNRDSMGYRFLLGRQAMKGRLIVDPDESFIHHKPLEDEVAACYQNHTTNKDRLKIIILGSNPELYSHKRLIEAGEKRGHDIRFVQVEHCYINVTHNEPKIFYSNGEILNNVDAVIPRLKPAISAFGCAIVRQFESIGTFCLNRATPISRARDKLRSLQVLSQKGVAMPNTSFAHSPVNTKSIIKLVGGAPIILKLLEGTQGKGVILADTNKAAESVINAFKNIKQHLLVQEFIKEAGNCDIRCFVIKNKVVAAMMRKAAEGDFRSNFHQGGSCHPIKITAKERKMAIRAAKILGLTVAGVDIIRSDEGPKILEVNSSPGLEGIEATTNKDIASLIIEAIEKSCNG